MSYSCMSSWIADQRFGKKHYLDGSLGCLGTYIQDGVHGVYAGNPKTAPNIRYEETPGTRFGDHRFIRVVCCRVPEKVGWEAFGDYGDLFWSDNQCKSSSPSPLILSSLHLDHLYQSRCQPSRFQQNRTRP